MTNRNFRVLLADRGEHIGQPCAAVLRAHGFEVELVEKDGRKLLEHIAAEPPDAVIMDFFCRNWTRWGLFARCAAWSWRFDRCWR